MAKSSSNYKGVFFNVFSGVLGGFSALMAVSLFSVIFIGAGYYIIISNNKNDDISLKNLHGIQYFGLVLCIIGSLPWLQYLFIGFFSNAGGYAFDALIDN
tara:strand:- start:386 stop:685 length:300 start_codon:yes stop_codon:yes gene_type:complete